MGAGRRPRHAFPPRGQRSRRTLAALAVGAARRRAQRGVTAAEPATVVVPGAESDGEAAFPARIDESRTPVRARWRVGVLEVRAEPVRGVEHLPSRPLPAHPLPLDGAGRVSREDDAIVLVRLVDDAALVVLDEVARDIQVVSGEVGEPVRRHLIDTEKTSRRSSTDRSRASFASWRNLAAACSGTSTAAA